MRKSATLLVCIALIASACGGETGDDSTTTTGEPADVERICVEDAARYGPDGACANFARDESVTSEVRVGGSAVDLPADLQNFVVVPPDAQNEDDFCLVVPNQVFVFPDNVENLILPGLVSITEVDPEELEIEISEDFLAFLEDSPLGLYVTTDEQPDIFSAIDAVEDQNDGAVVASPHYVLTPAPPSWTYGPSGTAQRISGTFGELAKTGPETADDGRVVIVDTGAPRGTALNLEDPEPEASAAPEVAGHGLFAASVARQFNDALDIDVYSADLGGPAPESAVVDALHRAAPSGNDVVSLSLGTYGCGDENPPLGLIQVLSELSGVRVAAASGNDGYADLMLWPASAGILGSITGLNLEVLEAAGIDLNDLRARVTAVGSMNRKGVRSDWSNRAESLASDEPVLAPGEDVVGLYNDGSGQPGLAVWSGTSFATPHFAACLASGVCTPP